MLGGNPADTSGSTSLLYAGEQFDTDLQQYYLRARFYDPINGRFNRTDPFAGTPHDPQSLHKYHYCHANPVNGIDPSGLEFSFTGAITVASIGMTLTSIALPVLGAAYMSVKNNLSPLTIIKHLVNPATWAAAMTSLLAGAGIAAGTSAVVALAAKKIGIEAAKRLMSVVGLFFAMAGLVQSIRMTSKMISGKLPARDAELYIAIMTAGIILTCFVRYAAKSGAIQKWFNKGSQNDKEYWGLTLEQRSAYDKGQSLVPNNVFRELTQGDSVSAAVTRGNEIKSLNENWLGVRGFWDMAVNGRSNGFTLLDWIATGPTPDVRLGFGNENVFAGAISGVLIGAEE